MLAKLIVWAPDRAQAIARMERALDELVLVGVSTNQGFHARLMRDEAFRCGEIDIQFLDRRPELMQAEPEHVDLSVAVAAALAEDAARRSRRPSIAAEGGAGSEWARLARREALQ
jgi:acetyl/propionyl-CoA carboxylase alpha subunit